MIAPGSIAAVLVGTIAPLRGDGRRTGFLKQPASGPVPIHPLGVAGDEIGNLRVHGGPEKAIYGYPVSGYAGWRAEFPGLATRFGPGAMGENLAVTGLDEDSVHIGDVIRAGTALLQVAQIREPCATFAAVYGTPRVVRAMTKSGRCGWYYRVLEPGSVGAGDGHDIIDRPNPDWPVARFARAAASKAGSAAALRELATLPGLTPAWQDWARQALARQRL